MIIWRAQVCVERCKRQRWERSSDGGDRPAIPSRLPLGSVLRQPHVSRPRRLPSQVRQLVLAMAEQDAILPSVLHAVNQCTGARLALSC